jgi:hypothetical protein
MNFFASTIAIVSILQTSFIPQLEAIDFLSTPADFADNTAAIAAMVSVLVRLGVAT